MGLGCSILATILRRGIAVCAMAASLGAFASDTGGFAVAPATSSTTLHQARSTGARPLITNQENSTSTGASKSASDLKLLSKSAIGLFMLF